MLEEIFNISNFRVIFLSQHQSKYKTGLLEIPSSTGLLCFFVFEIKTFEIDALQNANILTETKTVTLHCKIKTKNMNDNTRNDATYRPVSLNNESTPDATVFYGPAPAPTAGAASGGGWGPLLKSYENDEDLK